MMRLLDAKTIHELMPMRAAIDVLRPAFEMISQRQGVVTERQVMPLDGGTGLVMGAAGEGVGIACKLVAVMPGNTELNLPGTVGLVALLDDQTGMPLTVLDGTVLTALRTAALNGCAIEALSRESASTGLLVGCGAQATAQALAMTAVREFREFRVLGRDPERTSRFARSLEHTLAMRIKLETDPDEAVRGVDVITAVTNSDSPVVSGARIPRGCHVSGMGSFRPDMQELDLDLVAGSAVFVESREVAQLEAGDLIIAQQSDVTRPEQWTELGEVFSGDRPGRGDEAQITFFKSVGHPIFDLVMARALYDAAEHKNAGLKWQA